MSSKCTHESFTSSVTVNRLTNVDGEVTGYSAEVKIKCAVCGEDFVFKGVPFGMSHSEPRKDPDGIELRAPIEPPLQTLKLCTGFSAACFYTLL